MDKHAAQTMIQDTLGRSFDKGRFFYFLKNMLNHVEGNSSALYKGSHLPDSYKPSIESLERLGKYNDDEGNEIDLLVVQLKRETSLERARTLQRNFASWHLKGGTGGNLKDAALTAYVSPDQKDWRFSFVKMDYKFVQSEKGRVRVKEEFTPARRYSFLVGENENSHTAKSQLLPLLEDDDKKPTLGEIEDKFNIETVTKEFFEKYRDLFLRVTDSLNKIVKSDPKIKEDFIEKNVNTVDFSKKLLGQIVFLYFLQKKGWFGVEKNNDWGTGSKNFIRDLFNKKNTTYTNFFNEILEPLFYEALASERTSDFYAHLNCKIPFLNGGLFDPIGNYDWVHTDILLPNNLFSNKIQTAQGDIGIGIFDVFDRYNFTVKEDEPLEKEVAVDPEMLGKVFENLLEVKDRKSKGTFYTPREIVYYMCQESLAQHLVAELKGEVNKEDIGKLIHFGETVVEHDSRVARFGKETERYSYKLPALVIQNATALDRALANIRICDPAVGSGAFLLGMMSEIVRIRNSLSSYLGGCSKRTSYDFKRSAIQNSLYGVDLDSGAVDICKLRLWLSLVVDEDDISQIQPLPNLDYKIISGNSFLNIEKDLFNDRFFRELEELKPKYFEEASGRKKQQFKKKIDSLIKKITHGKKDFDFEVYFSEIFHEKKGFDIVLANPPYYQLSKDKTVSGDYKLYLKKKYRTSGGRLNMFIFFIHQGIGLLHMEGILCYIIPNTILTQEYYRETRKLILDNATLQSIVTYDKMPFEHAVVENVTIVLSKQVNLDYDIAIYGQDKSAIELLQTKRKEDFNKPPTYAFAIFSNPLVDRIFSSGYDSLDMHCLINQGIALKGDRSLSLGRACPKPNYYKVLDGRNINKYNICWDGKYLEYNIERIHSCKRKDIFETDEKLFFRRVSREFIFAYDNSQYYALNTLVVVNRKDTSPLSLKYLLALLNAKLLNYIYKSQFKSTKKVFSEIQARSVGKIPVKVIPTDEQETLICLTDEIMTLKRDNPESDTTILAQEIDQLVYELYDLTPEEIKLVEEEN
jgi:hypothetical protein